MSWFSGPRSTSIINQLNQQLSEAISKTMQDCTSTSTSKQDAKINNSGWMLFGTIGAKQVSTINSACFSDVNKQTDLQNEIINTIKNATTSSGVALLSAFGGGSSEAESNLRSMVSNSITMSNIQKNYNSIKQSQGGVIKNSKFMLYASIDLSQGVEIFVAATLQQVEASGITNKIASYIDQSATTKSENPLAFIADLFAQYIGVVGMIIITIILAIVYAIFGRGSSTPSYGKYSATSRYNQTPYQTEPDTAAADAGLSASEPNPYTPRSAPIAPMPNTEYDGTENPYTQRSKPGFEQSRYPGTPRPVPALPISKPGFGDSDENPYTQRSVPALPISKPGFGDSDENPLTSRSGVNNGDENPYTSRSNFSA